MQNQVNTPLTPESLARIVRAQFPEILEMDDIYDYNYRISIDPTVENTSPFVKSLDDYLRDFLGLHGDPHQDYRFSITRGSELINKLAYNDPDFEIHINLELNGSRQILRIVDLLGEGDYLIYDREFNLLGALHNERGSRWFAPDVPWQLSSEALRPYLQEIVDKIRVQLDSRADDAPLVIDVDDPEDLLYWATQFELSEADLKKAILAAGTDVDAVTSYLQK